jgi:hypothetical protein
MVATLRLTSLFFAALLACGSPQLGPGRGRDPQLITEEEVVASLATTAYEVIHNLRPNFLSYRGETSFDKNTSRPYPNVYVDDQPYGPVSILRSIPASDVSSIRLYRSWEATTKYGSGNAGGVIAISTRH